MKISRFQHIESDAKLLHFALNKKLMQIETYLPITSMVLIINYAD